VSSHIFFLRYCIHLFVMATGSLEVHMQHFVYLTNYHQHQCFAPQTIPVIATKSIISLPPLVSGIQSVYLDVYYFSSLILAKRVTQINKFYFSFYQSSTHKTQLQKLTKSITSANQQKNYTHTETHLSAGKIIYKLLFHCSPLVSHACDKI